MADPDLDPTVVPLKPTLPEGIKESAGMGDDQAHLAREHGRTTGDPGGSETDRDEGSQPPGFQKPDSQPLDGPYRIKGIQVNKSDARGLLITHVYAVQSGEYAVYKAGEVMVQFADDPEKAQAQR